MTAARARFGIVFLPASLAGFGDLCEYHAHQHEIAGAADASLPDRFSLTDFLVDRFAIVGTPADCVAQIRRAMGAGARQFMITGFVPDPRAFVRRWTKEVAGAL